MLKPKDRFQFFLQFLNHPNNSYSKLTCYLKVFLSHNNTVLDSVYFDQLTHYLPYIVYYRPINLKLYINVSYTNYKPKQKI